MPEETSSAVDWALKQKAKHPIFGEYRITKETSHELVDKVREYFNDNNIDYGTFSFEDLKPYLN